MKCVFIKINMGLCCNEYKILLLIHKKSRDLEEVLEF